MITRISTYSASCQSFKIWRGWEEGEAKGGRGKEREGVKKMEREWEGEGTDRVSSNGAEPPKQMKLKLNNNYVNIHGE